MPTNQLALAAIGIPLCRSDKARQVIEMGMEDAD
jgi:hypothetical protein